MRRTNDTCLSYGAKHGSDAYVRCRTDLQPNRAIELAATQPVFADPVAGHWGAARCSAIAVSSECAAFELLGTRGKRSGRENFLEGSIVTP